MEEPLQNQTTTQCTGLPPTCARGHHPDGPKADHALTFNSDHSSGAAHDFVLDALNQAICQRAPPEAGSLIHHSDRGSQYLSIKYTERLAEAGIDPSLGSVGDSYNNALVESTIGLFKTEVIDFMGSWKSV